MKRSIIFLIAIVYCNVLKADLQGELITLKKKLTVLHAALPKGPGGLPPLPAGKKGELENVKQQLRALFDQMLKFVQDDPSITKESQLKFYFDQIPDIVKNLSREQEKEVRDAMLPSVKKIGEIIEARIENEIKDTVAYLSQKLREFSDLLKWHIDNNQLIPKQEAQNIYQIYQKVMDKYNTEQRADILLQIRPLLEHIDEQIATAFRAFLWFIDYGTKPWSKDLYPEFEIESEEEEEEESEEEAAEKLANARRKELWETFRDLEKLLSQQPFDKVKTTILLNLLKLMYAVRKNLITQLDQKDMENLITQAEEMLAQQPRPTFERASQPRPQVPATRAGSQLPPQTPAPRERAGGPRERRGFITHAAPELLYGEEQPTQTEIQQFSEALAELEELMQEPQPQITKLDEALKTVKKLASKVKNSYSATSWVKIEYIIEQAEAKLESRKHILELLHT